MDINKILADPKIRAAIIHKLCKEEKFVRFRGDVTLTLRGSDGGIKGKRLVRNLVVDTGLWHIMDNLEDSPDEAEMGWAAIGDNNTAAAAGNTALYSELGRVALTSKIQGTAGNANQVTYSATVPAGTGTGTIVEAGIFNANSGGVMLARSIFSPIVKGAGDAIDITWVMTASAA
jgi:hypothetical protein